MGPSARLACMLRKQLMLFPPIDLAKVSECLGITVEIRDFEPGVVGLCVISPNGKAWIALNSSLEWPRLRFTWAHELGHFLLKEDISEKPSIHLFEEYNSETERECNEFAAELLMPPKLVSSRLYSLRHLDIRSRINEMCQTFQVSRWAMLRRIEELGLNL